MNNFIKYRKKFFQTAILSSPLIGIYSIIPVIFFIHSDTENLPIQLPNYDKITILTTIISLGVLTMWMWNILLEYLYQNKLFIRSVKANTALKYFISYAIVYTAVLIFRLYLAPYFLPEKMGFFRYSLIVGIFAVNGFIILMINLIATRSDRSELMLQKAQLEISRLIMQQEQLKQQIHPHFLFNALSTLKILIDNQPKRAGKYTSELADYLRDSIDLGRQDLQSINGELKILMNYINIQKTRFRKGIQITVVIPEEIVNQAKLPIFALQILAENAIKHNAFSELNPLKIHIVYNSKGIIEVFNQKSSKYNPPESTGIGLKNLFERFGHFTDKKPIVKETEQEFKVLIPVLGV